MLDLERYPTYGADIDIESPYSWWALELYFYSGLYDNFWELFWAGVRVVMMSEIPVVQG